MAIGGACTETKSHKVLQLRWLATYMVAIIFLPLLFIQCCPRPVCLRVKPIQQSKCLFGSVSKSFLTTCLKPSFAEVSNSHDMLCFSWFCSAFDVTVAQSRSVTFLRSAQIKKCNKSKRSSQHVI